MKYNNNRKADYEKSREYEPGSSISRVNHIFDWTSYSNRILFSKKCKATTPVADNTLILRIVGVPFMLDEHRAPYDPKFVRVARFANEERRQYITILPKDDAQSPILKILRNRGVFHTVQKIDPQTGRKKYIPVYANHDWYDIISTDSFGVNQRGESYKFGKGWLGQTQVFFQALDRMSEDDKTTKLIFRDPYIKETGELIWATPGFAELLFHGALKELTRKGTKYEYVEDWDLLISRHPQFQSDSQFGHYFGIAELAVEGNDDPYGSRKEDGDLKEWFHSLKPYVKSDPIPEDVDLINLDELFPLTNPAEIFEHIKYVLKSMDDSIPGIYEELKRACDVNDDDIFVKDNEEELKSPIYAKQYEEYIKGINKRDELVFTNKFHETFNSSEKSMSSCGECSKLVPLCFDICPFCGCSLD